MGTSPADEAKKAQRQAEAARQQELDAFRAEEEKKRKVRQAQRKPVDVIATEEEAALGG